MKIMQIDAKVNRGEAEAAELLVLGGQLETHGHMLAEMVSVR